MYLAYNIDQLWAFTSQFKLLGELWSLAPLYLYLLELESGTKILEKLKVETNG
jgi:hypothetical protein